MFCVAWKVLPGSFPGRWQPGQRQKLSGLPYWKRYKPGSLASIPFRLGGPHDRFGNEGKRKLELSSSRKRGKRRKRKRNGWKWKEKSGSEKGKIGGEEKSGIEAHVANEQYNSLHLFKTNFLSTVVKSYFLLHDK